MYLITISFVCLMWPLSRKFSNRKLCYVCLVWLWLFGIFALRAPSVGTDTPVYIYRFEYIRNSSWKNLQYVSERFQFEYGFTVLTKLISMITESPRIYLLILSTFFITVLCRFIYLYSEMPWLSFYMYITLGFFASSLSAARQVLSIALCMIAIKYILNDKMIMFVFIIILAGIFHTSVLTVLPMFWISKLKYSKKLIAIIVSLLVAIAAFGNALLISFANLLRMMNVSVFKVDSYYRFIDATNIRNGAVGITLIYLVFTILVIYAYYSETGLKKGTAISFSAISLAISFLTFYVGMIARLNLTFGIFYLCTVPNSINKIKDEKSRFLFLISTIAVLLFYYIAIVARANTSSSIPFTVWSN